METIIRYIANNAEVADKIRSGKLEIAGVSPETNNLLKAVFTNDLNLKTVVVNAWKY